MAFKTIPVLFDLLGGFARSNKELWDEKAKHSLLIPRASMPPCLLGGGVAPATFSSSERDAMMLLDGGNVAPSIAFPGPLRASVVDTVHGP